MSEQDEIEKELSNLMEKKEWNHIASIDKWKDELIKLFIEAASLLVHAFQIDMKIKKNNFTKPKKDIFKIQKEQFDSEHIQGINMEGIVKSILKKQNLATVNHFTHFSKTIETCLGFFFNINDIKKELDLDEPVQFFVKYNTPDLLKKSKNEEKYLVKTSLPLVIGLRMIMSGRSEILHKLKKDKNNEIMRDLLIKVEEDILFQIFAFSKQSQFFEDKEIKNVFETQNRDTPLYHTLLSGCFHIYELYYFAYYSSELFIIKSIVLKQYILDYIIEQFMLLDNQIAFHKGIIYSKVNRALLNQSSPKKGVEKKSQLFASMVSDKGVTKNDIIEIKSIDLFKIFNHGDIAIASDPTEKKYLQIAEKILKKKIHKI